MNKNYIKFLVIPAVILVGGNTLNINDCYGSDNNESLTSNNINEPSSNKIIDVRENVSNNQAGVDENNEQNDLVNNTANDSLSNKDNNKSLINNTDEVQETNEQKLADYIVNQNITYWSDNRKNDLTLFRKNMKDIIKDNDFNNKKLTSQDVKEFFDNIKVNNNLLQNISALFYQINTDDSDENLKIDLIDIWQLLEYYNKNDNNNSYKITRKELADDSYSAQGKNNLLFAIIDYYLKSILNNMPVQDIDFIDGEPWDEPAKQKLQEYSDKINYAQYCDTILKERLDVMSEKLKQKIKEDNYAFCEKNTLKEYEKTFKNIKNELSVSDWNKVVGKDGRLLNNIKNFVLLFNKLQDNIKYAYEHPKKDLSDQITELMGIDILLEYNSVINHKDYLEHLKKYKNVKLQTKEDAKKILEEVKKELGIKDDNQINNNKQQVNHNVPMPQMNNNHQMMQPMMYQPPMFNNYNPWYYGQMQNYSQHQFNNYQPHYYNNYQQQQMMYNQYNNMQNQNMMYNNSQYNNNLQYQNQQIMQNNQQYNQNYNNQTMSNNNNLQNKPNNNSLGNGIYEKPNEKFLKQDKKSIYNFVEEE